MQLINVSCKRPKVLFTNQNLTEENFGVGDGKFLTRSKINLIRIRSGSGEVDECFMCGVCLYIVMLGGVDFNVGRGTGRPGTQSGKATSKIL